MQDKAAGIICVAWENGETQIADLLTKLMPRPRLKELIVYGETQIADLLTKLMPRPRLKELIVYVLW
jgi:hypothetical protein